jgi:(R,R)-butanediol dehydrogenase/meso-butanediol dehydrogenase/diacetyl reductase
MRAVRWHARGDVRVDFVPAAPPPGPGEVRVRVEWCGICGTDREEWRAGPLFIPTERPHPLTGTKAPITLGHEVSATITDVGAGVAHLRTGQLVALDGLITCGRCWWCRRHEVTLCPDLAAVGLHLDGGLAEAMTVPALMALSVPDGVDAQTAALAEPLSVAVRALRRGRLVAGETVLIQGAGMIGLAAFKAARALGAASVTVADPSLVRREQALRLGADAVVDSKVPEFPQEVLRLHHGRGPDLVIEAVGTPAGCEQASLAARRGGRVVFVGLPALPGALDFFQLVAAERELIGSLSHVWDEDFAAAVAMLGDGILRADDVVSARLPLEHAVDHGFDSMARRNLPGVKFLVSPWI